jgi:hypothetical protein
VCDGRSGAGAGGTGNAALAPGDAYTLVDTGNEVVARRVVDAATTVHGVCEAVALTTSSGSESYKVVPAGAGAPLTTPIEIVGIEDKDAEFEVQMSAAFDNGMIGKLFDLVDTAPDTTLGVSLQELDSTTEGTGSEFRLTRLINRPLNTEDTNAKVGVRLVNVVA